ncbi:E3 ubiquitin-protein ligase TRAIP [Pyrenophora teres f. maculata]|nr:E3 ubiquitin-protein ligase TRAIP [Pyrenophora teres f. maculata]
MPLPTRTQFFRDHLQPLRILPGAPQYADIGICVVCQEDFNDESYDMVIIRGCHHIFHRRCLIEWAESTSPQRDACPSCRKRVYQHVPLTIQQIGELSQEEIEDEIFAPDSPSSGMEVVEWGWQWEDGRANVTGGRDQSGQTPPDVEIQTQTAEQRATPGESTPVYHPGVYIDSWLAYDASLVGQTPESEPRPNIPSATWPPTYVPTHSSSSHIPHWSESTAIEVHREDPDNAARIAHMRDLLSTHYTIFGEFSGVRSVFGVPEGHCFQYVSGENHAVRDAVGYVMIGQTAMFYRERHI